jgi:hypothetical protein
MGSNPIRVANCTGSRSPGARIGRVARAGPGVCKYMLTIVGRTEDGKDVYGGVYQFFETHGMPLDILFSILHDKNAVPCWMSFHREALAAGMKHERILSKIDEALSDAHGPGFRDAVIKRLQALHAKGLL